MAGPLAGSPKFQVQPVIVPDAGGIVDVVLLNAAAFFSQISAEYVNCAEALSSTVIDRDIVSTQPPVDDVNV